MLKYSIFFFLLLGNFISTAQHQFSVSFNNRTFAATDSLLPFWFGANQYGKVQPEGAFLNLSDLYISGNSADNSSKIQWEWGVNPVIGLSQTAYMQLNRAFAGLEFPWLGTKRRDVL